MKKTLPLVFLREFKKVTNDHLDIISIDNSQTDCIVKFKNNDPSSNFFYKILKINGGHCDYAMSPVHSVQVQPHEFKQIPIRGAIEGFKTWYSLVKEYNSITTILDDPNTKRLSDEYFAQFKFTNNDGVTPYSINEIPRIYEFFEDIKVLIKDNINDSKIEQQFLLEISNLQEDLTTESKANIIKRFSSLWAKLSIIKTMFVKEFSSQAIKLLVKNSIEWVTSNIQNIDI